MKRLAFIGLTAALLAGCGEPKLDGTSEEAFKKSVANVAQSLSEDKRQQFGTDLKVVTLANVDMASVLAGKANTDDVSTAIFSHLNGKTAEQVSTEAARILAERQSREDAQAMAEIKELILKRDEAETAKADLAKFSVSKSRFYFYKGEYDYRAQPRIELSVTNGTSIAVSRAYFKGTLASPGRSIPWLVEDFNYEISGGLEPGETQSWTLEPNSFGKWGKVDAPKDAVFTVEVVRIDGPDGKALYDSAGFSDRDAERLRQLHQKYPN